MSKQLFRPEVEGLTPYQPGRPVEDVQRELGLERVVKLASNEGPYPPFPSALAAMAGELELNRYPDGGAYRLHHALDPQLTLDVLDRPPGLVGREACLLYTSDAADE